jgi:predicted small metal-binding protein
MLTERAIMKTLACKDMGMECDYISMKPTAEEVKADMLEHAQKEHADMLAGMSDQDKTEMMHQMDQRMRDAA